jgi:hypothetical protein
MFWNRPWNNQLSLDGIAHQDHHIPKWNVPNAEYARYVASGMCCISIMHSSQFLMPGNRPARADFGLKELALPGSPTGLAGVWNWPQLAYSLVHNQLS